MGAQARILILLGLMVVGSSQAAGEAAIAFSQEPNGRSAWGSANNHATAADADNAALRFCHQRGTNCQTVANFRKTCGALAVQDSGNGWAVRYDDNLARARQAAQRGCVAMGRSCTVTVAICDRVMEIVKTLICTHPVFAETRKLTATIDGTPQKTKEVADAINYLQAKYCREIEMEGRITSDQDTNVGDNCWQYSGVFRGERVYWGQCSE